MQNYKAKISLYWNLNNVVKYSFAMWKTRYCIITAIKFFTVERICRIDEISDFRDSRYQ